MPYEDPAKQREYLRTWRRNRRLQETVSPSQRPTQRTVRNKAARQWSLSTSLASFRAAPTADQQMLKMSPDGAPQTGRMATQAYWMNRSQRTTTRISPKTTPTHRSPVVFPKANTRHLAMPMASLLVEVLSRFF
jgi:hypothetical protein